MESMSAHYGAGTIPENISEQILSNPQATDCFLPMGITSENVAKDYGITREEQDVLPPKAMQKRCRPRRKASSRVKLCPSG